MEKLFLRVIIHQTEIKDKPCLDHQSWGLETLGGTGGTTFAALLLVLTALQRRTLWRDETNTPHLAQMTSLKELCIICRFESFPRALAVDSARVGLSGPWRTVTQGVRILGVGGGVALPRIAWRCSRLDGESHAYLERSLLGSLPALYFIIGANRAYGLASCCGAQFLENALAVVEFPSTVAGSLGGSHLLSFRHTASIMMWCSCVRCWPAEPSW